MFNQQTLPFCSHETWAPRFQWRNHQTDNCPRLSRNAPVFRYCRPFSILRLASAPLYRTCWLKSMRTFQPRDAEIRITPPNTDTVHRTPGTAHQTCASSTQPQRWHLPRNHRANAIVDVIAQYTAAVDCLMLGAVPSSMLHGDRPLPDQVLSRRISAQISALTFSVSE